MTCSRKRYLRVLPKVKIKKISSLQIHTVYQDEEMTDIQCTKPTHQDPRVNPNPLTEENTWCMSHALGFLTSRDSDTERVAKAIERLTQRLHIHCRYFPEDVDISALRGCWLEGFSLIGDPDTEGLTSKLPDFLRDD